MTVFLTRFNSSTIDIIEYDSIYNWAMYNTKQVDWNSSDEIKYFILTSL